MGSAILRLPVDVRERRAQLRVVVADDNVDAAVTLARLLELSGFAMVEVVHTGPAALDSVLRHRPDVALLDIALPEMDGYQIAKTVRQRLGHKTRLIAVTGLARSSDRDDACEAGFDAHFVKPMDWADVEHLLDCYAEHSHGEHDAYGKRECCVPTKAR